MSALILKKIWQDVDFFEVSCTAKTDNICIKSKTYMTDLLIDELCHYIDEFVDCSLSEFVWGTGDKGDAFTIRLHVFYKGLQKRVIIEYYTSIDDDVDSDHSCCIYIKDKEINDLIKLCNGLKRLKTKELGVQLTI